MVMMGTDFSIWCIKLLVLGGVDNEPQENERIMRKHDFVQIPANIPRVFWTVEREKIHFS